MSAKVIFIHSDHYIPSPPALHEQSMNHISLKKYRPRCYVKSPTAQDAFRPIPGLISCAGVTGRWELLYHAQNTVRWLALSKRSVEALRRHRLFACMPSCMHDADIVPGFASFATGFSSARADALHACYS